MHEKPCWSLYWNPNAFQITTNLRRTVRIYLRRYHVIFESTAQFNRQIYKNKFKAELVGIRKSGRFYSWCDIYGIMISFLNWGFICRVCSVLICSYLPFFRSPGRVVFRVCGISWYFTSYIFIWDTDHAFATLKSANVNHVTLCKQATVRFHDFKVKKVFSQNVNQPIRPRLKTGVCLVICAVLDFCAWRVPATMMFCLGQLCHKGWVVVR